MSSFNWVGGSGALNDALHWTPNDPQNPVVPGSNDFAEISGASGTLTGSLGANQATIDGNFVLQGSISSVFDTFVHSGEVIVDSGATIGGGGLALNGGKVHQKAGGTSTATTNAFSVDKGSDFQMDGGYLTVAGATEIGLTAASTVEQNNGKSSMQVLLLHNGSYELADGLLNVGTQHEYVGDQNHSTGIFRQIGGSHFIQGDLILGYGGGTGRYIMKGGSVLKDTAEFIGQNSSGTFIQSAGKNIVSDRIVLGINLTSGANGDGTYTLGGSGALSVKTVFIGSDPNCTGTFNFNTAASDNALLTIAGTGGFPGLIVGGQGIGKFYQGFGELKSTVAVGYRATGQGTYSMDLGTLISSDEEIGVAGHGVFNQRTGTHNIVRGAGSKLDIGVEANSDGKYFLTGVTSGALQVTDLIVGDSGKGAFYLNAPPVLTTDIAAQVSGTLTLGVHSLSTGTFTQTRGTISAHLEIVGDEGTGNYVQDGGQNSTTDLTIGKQFDSHGKYLISGTGKLTVSSGGYITLGDEVGSHGTLRVTGGDVKVKADNIIIGSHGKGALIVEDSVAGAKNIVTTNVVIHTGSTLDAGEGGELTIGIPQPHDSSINILVGKTGSLFGAGTVFGRIAETKYGSITASGGVLALQDDVVGGGTLHIAAAATLDLGGRTTNTVDFSAASGILKLEHPDKFDGAVTHFQLGDVIDLVGVSITDIAYGNGVLKLTEADDSELTFKVSGSIAGNVFVQSSDGHGGTKVGLQVAPHQVPPDTSHADDALAQIAAHDAYALQLATAHSDFLL